MNSAGHRANILSVNSNQLGVGYAAPVWTQVFGFTSNQSCGNSIYEALNNEQCDGS